MGGWSVFLKITKLPVSVLIVIVSAGPIGAAWSKSTRHVYLPHSRRASHSYRMNSPFVFLYFCPISSTQHHVFHVQFPIALRRRMVIRNIEACLPVESLQSSFFFFSFSVQLKKCKQTGVCQHHTNLNLNWIFKIVIAFHYICIAIASLI